MHINLSEKKSIIAARTTVIIIAILGLVIARNPASSVFSIVSFAWAGFGAAFGPVIILSLYWKRSTGLGALCGMISGGLMVLVWKFMIKPIGGIFGIYELLPAFLVGLIVMVIVSLCSKKPEQSVIDEFNLASSHAEIK